MGDQSYRLLRGKAVAQEFKPVVSGGKSASPPRPDPPTHRQRLLAQLDALAASVRARSPDQRDQDATREIIAVRLTDPDHPPKLEQLANRADDVRVVGSDPLSG